MSLIKKNIIANFLGQGWVSLMSFLFLPVYLHFLGSEAYGLVGFYVMLTVSMAILDVGLGAACSRELAKLSAEPSKAHQTIRDLMRSLEYIFWGISVFIAIFVYLLSPFIAEHWLNLDTIPAETAIYVIKLMGISLIFQFPLALYNGALIGIQSQKMMNIINASSMTLKGAGSALLLWLVSPTLEIYFLWQIGITILQSLVMFYVLWREMPSGEKPKFNLNYLKSIKKYALGVGAINVVSLALTQVDKIILSTLLPLKQFGYYTLAWTISSLLFKIISPVYFAYFPKITQLIAQNDEANLCKVYLQSTQLMAVVIIPFALMLAYFPFGIIELWTQNIIVAEEIRYVVPLLVVGTMCNGIMNIPYALQLADGWTSLALKTNSIAVLVMIPLTYFLTQKYGMIGAAFVWPLINISYIIFTPQIMHAKILPHSKGAWYIDAVFKPIIITTIIYSTVKWSGLISQSLTLKDILFLFILGGITLLVVASALPEARKLLRAGFNR